ncbi:MAG TPA: riboflavin synthase [Flavobacteriales bacterium]|nr:riboflavin synthase [Flavobacteriales bacterium]
MFTGIIECLGTVEEVKPYQTNLIITISSPISKELSVDQSIAHNGVCLTVVESGVNTHKVVAIAETLSKTELGQWKQGTKVNLERCLQMNGRLDGHIVQGHVDTVATCDQIDDLDGSWKFWFSYDKQDPNVTIEKGSITVNGTSLTVVDSVQNTFSVCIIPYTFEHTNFSSIKVGTQVNIEFDVVGKYVAKLLARN